MNWEERYVKEAFKIKFWEREDDWGKMLKDSPYKNLSDPTPSFTILDKPYQCELCGTKQYAENVFKDSKNDNYYCKSHYLIPKVNTYNVRNDMGETISKGKDTKEISRKVRDQTAKLYNLDNKRKEKEENKRQLKDFTQDTRPLDAIFANVTQSFYDAEYI